MFNALADPTVINQEGVIDVDALLAWVAQNPLPPPLPADPVTPKRQRRQTPLIDTPPPAGPDFFRGFFFLVPTSRQPDLYHSLYSLYHRNKCLLVKAVEQELGSGHMYVAGYIFFEQLQSEQHVGAMFDLPAMHGCVWKGSHLHHSKAVEKLDSQHRNASALIDMSCLPDEHEFDSQAETQLMGGS
jgi:hypothetical protein